MKIVRFLVQGYKNLKSPLVLDDLPDIVIVHGDNNVGKSNLLEALSLAFRLLNLTDKDNRLPFVREAMVSAEAFRDQTGLAAMEIFTLGSPAPIRIELDLAIRADELDAAGIYEVEDTARVSIHLRLSPAPGGVSWKIDRFLFGERDDATAAPDSEMGSRLRKYALFLTKNFIVGGRALGLRFNLLNVHRQLLNQQEAPSDRQIVADELALQLYDAKESLEPAHHARWLLFSDLVSRFADLIGPGEIVATYDRASGRARLAVQAGGQRMAVHLLGSGVQQIIGLFGQIVMSGASLLAVEEPELNLRYTHQHRLRALLQEIVDDGRGPTQLFLTSHSAAFEGQSPFYGMTAAPEGPQVHRYPPDLAARFTGQDAGAAPSTEGAPLSYVSTEGIVRVPPTVLQQMGLARGGGVVFCPAGDGRAEMWSNPAWLAQFGEE
jgi:predicted ATPase